MLNGKTMVILLIVGLIKKTYKTSQYVHKPHKTSAENVKVELDLFFHERKADLKKQQD